MAKFGFWSQEFVKRGHRTCFWSTPDGNEIEVCFIGTSTTPPTSWPDVKLKGEVVDWLRHGQESLMPKE